MNKQLTLSSVITFYIINLMWY